MNKRWTRHIIVFFLCYVMFMVALMPANFIYKRAADRFLAQPPNIRLQGVEGQIWQGQAQRLEVAGQHFQEVSWDLHLLPLLLGRGELGVRFHDPETSGMAVMSTSLLGQSHSFRDVKAELPLSRLAGWLKLPFDNVNGMLRLDLSALELVQKQWTQAEGRIDVLNASMAGRIPLELGDVHISVKTEKNTIVAILKDGGGGLQLDGVFKMTPSGEYQFNGTLATRANASDSLKNALVMLGTPGIDGRVQVNNAGRWPAF